MGNEMSLGKNALETNGGCTTETAKQCYMTRASGGVGTDGRRRLFAQNGFYGGV